MGTPPKMLHPADKATNSTLATLAKIPTNQGAYKKYTSFAAYNITAKGTQPIFSFYHQKYTQR
jgi:hypothetical protein